MRKEQDSFQRQQKIYWWIREAIHSQQRQERTMIRDMGQFKLSSMYIPILSDCKTGDTPSTVSQRQSDEACSKQEAKAHNVK